MYMRLVVVAGFGRMGLGWNVGGCGEGGKVRRVGKEGRKEEGRKGWLAAKGMGKKTGTLGGFRFGFRRDMQKKRRERGYNGWLPRGS